jgi:hypothetical protein
MVEGTGVVGVPACAQSGSEEREKEQEKDSAETRRAQRFPRKNGDAGRGWRSMFTVYGIGARDDLSSYFLYSNDSNGVHMRRKLITGLGMRGNLALKIGICERSG